MIAFPSGALSEIVVEGHAGFLVRGKEEMARAIRRSSEIDPLTCHAEAESRFSLAHTIENYFSLYQALVAGEALDPWLGGDPFHCTRI